MRTRTLIPAVFVVSLALAACSSPAVENSGVDAPPTTPAADDFSDVSSYYPVGEGNTWQYEMVMPDPIGTVVETETMTEVVRDGDAVRATIERTFHYESGFAEDVTDSVD